MAFREPAFHPASGSVRYGPFPVRTGRLAFALLLVLVALVVALVALAQDHLTCTPGATCVVTRAFPSRTLWFPMSALRDARVDIERGSKGGSHGMVILVMDDGRELPLQRVTPERAAEVGAAIRAGLSSEQRIDVTLRGPWWTFPFALVMLAITLSMARSAAKGLGRFRLDVTRGGAALRVQRYLLAIPVSSREVSLEGVADVRVERGTLGEGWLNKGEAPSPAGRIVLVDRSGATRPLTDAFFPGEAVHLRAASDLREILDLERRRHGVEEQLASLPRVVTPLGARVAALWTAAAVGAVAGLALFGLTGLALGLLRTRDPLEVWHIAAGGGGGAIAGVALTVYLTRSRPPR